MKKYILKKKALLFGGMCGLLLIGFIVFLLFEAFYGGNHFRTLQDDIPDAQGLDLRGLRTIQASGGNMPRFSYLQNRLSDVKKKKIIVDVKCEPHGYINGIPSTFLGYGLESNFRRRLRRLILTGTVDEMPTAPESEVAKKYGFDYKAVSIGSKFAATDDNIEDIVHFFDTLPQDVWIHVHCTNGRGRTSTILVMLDIMKNAPMVSLAAIVDRHHRLGSSNLFDTTVWKKGTYSKEQLEARKNFIVDFYNFICQRKEIGGIRQWSTWRHQQVSRTL